MPFGLAVDVLGARRAIKKLEKLPNNLRRKGLTQGVSASAGVFKKAAKAHAPTDTGLLSRSFTVKRVKTRDKSISRRVQPKSQRFATVNVRRQGKLAKRKVLTGAVRRKIAGQGLGRSFRNPARYAHLVELGHAAPGRGIRRGGAGRFSQSVRRLTRRFSGKSTPPHRFMKPAFRASRRLALSAMTRQVKTFLEMQKP